MKKIKINWEALVFFSIGIILGILGILMLISDRAISGVHGLTQQYSVLSGGLVCMGGILMIFLGYLKISVYSKFREFFEGKPKTKKDKSDSKKL